MKSNLHLAQASLLAVLLWAVVPRVGAAAATESEIKKARDMIYPATVRVDVRRAVYAEGQKRWTGGTGSGFIIDQQGHVVTNYHVAGEATEIKCVMFNKERVKARLVGGDPWTDIAVLELDQEELKGKCPNFVVARLGDSDKVEPGDAVVAVGAPHGLSRTITAGIICCQDRMLPPEAELPGGHETGMFNTWLQTDAVINPGNSGGPLANMAGEVIGINSRGGGGLGFAVPINVAKEVIAQILKNGRVMRSEVGILLQPLQDLEGLVGANLDEGVLIGGVTPDSPAEAAGLKPRDVMLEFDGKKITGRYPEDIFAIRALMANTPVGKTVNIVVRRGDKNLTFSLKTEELTQAKDKDVEFKEWGLVAQLITERMARKRDFPNTKGIFVSSVRPGLPASRANIQEGDVIIAVDDKAVDDLNSFRRIYDEKLSQDVEIVLIKVRRGEAIYSLPLRKVAWRPTTP